MRIKMKIIKKRHIIAIIVLLIIGFCWLNNTNLFSSKDENYKLLAHRGLAQCFDVSQVEWDTNTAAIIYIPEHEYLENTLVSMEIAFEYGADVVELDIQRTKDGKLAVFHDYNISMRTEADGVINEYTMDELKKLDIGYGYTADHGKTYPFREKGVGLMPELKEVFEKFPDKDLLIHMKSGDVETAEILWSYLEEMPWERINKITIYGNHDGLMYLREQKSDIRILSMETLKKGLLKYELFGWMGYIPKELENTEIHIPLQYAKLLWGWPNKFVDRMELINTRVVIVQGNGKWSEGFDTVESLDNIPEGYSGYVWTNRIDIVTESAD